MMKENCSGRSRRKEAQTYTSVHVERGNHHAKAPRAKALAVVAAILLAVIPGGQADQAVVLRVGSEVEFPPYAFVDQTGQAAGFSVDLIRAVAEVMGLRIEITTGTWDSVWSRLVAGQLDVLPIVALLPDRAQLVDFSLPHTETYDAFFVRRGSPAFANIEAAQGKEIVVMRSDAAHHALMEKHFQGHLTLVDTIPAGLSLVASGRHDAFLCSKLIGSLTLQKLGGIKLSVGPPIPDYKRTFSFAVKQGNPELLEKLNQGLMIIKANGEYQRIHDRWLSVYDPWSRWKRYLAPVALAILAVIIAGGIGLMSLRRMVRKATQELAEKNERLRQIQEGLETAIAERTAELQSANAGLQVEVAERKRTEDALRESESHFRGYFELGLIGMAITSVEKGWMQFNDRMCEMLGYTREELRQKTWAQLTHPDDLEKDNAQFHRVLLGEIEGYGLNKRFLRKDGGVIHAELSIKCLRREDGSVDHFMVMVSDVTERKRAQAEKEKLEFQNRQLQKAESLGRMAGAIAHHFNNQLQAVMMSLQMAINELPKNGMDGESLIEAMLSARKAAKVSTLMLTYLGQTTAKHEPLYLCDACQQQLAMLQASLPKDMVLETDFPTPGPVIHANTNQIQQVLVNLVTNAWEALGAPKGSIRVAVKTICAAGIPVENRFPVDWRSQDTDCACLEVTDAGCGIASEDIDKLFDPFFSTKFTGRGLGLAVVLGIVRAHGGCVTVESQPSRGSVLRVFLPLSAEAVPLKPAPVVQAPRMAEGGTVLVVDDEPVLRKGVTIALKRSGFTVFDAQDGVEAVEVFKLHRDEIGCVLCDLTMPRMNGWETLTALRKLSPGIAVILSSGYSEAQAMAGDHPELPQAFLSKPYEWAALRDTIVRVMKNPKELR